MNNTQSNSKKIESIKRELLSTPSAMVGIYAAAKILPKLLKGHSSKKAFESYKAIGLTTFKTFGQKGINSDRFTLLGLNDVNTIAEKSFNKGAQFNSTYKNNIENSNKHKNLTNEFNVEVNTDSYSNLTAPNMDKNINRDSISLLGMSPEYKQAYEELMGEIFTRYRKEQSTQIGDISLEGMNYVIKDSLSTYNKVDYDVENTVTNKDINNKEDIEKSNLNDANIEDAYNSHNDVELPDNNIIENTNFNAVDNNLTDNYINNKIDYTKVFNDISRKNADYIDYEKDDATNEFVSNASEKDDLKNRLNFESMLNTNNFNDIKNIYATMESDIDKLPSNVSIHDSIGSESFDINSSDLYSHSIEEVDCVMKRADDIPGVQSTKYDKIQLGHNGGVIFRIEPSGKIYLHYNFNGRRSNEKEITNNEYLSYKEDSINMYRNKELEKEKRLSKENNEYSL